MHIYICASPALALKDVSPKIKTLVTKPTVPSSACTAAPA